MEYYKVIHRDYREIIIERLNINDIIKPDPLNIFYMLEEYKVIEIMDPKFINI